MGSVILREVSFSTLQLFSLGYSLQYDKEILDIVKYFINKTAKIIKQSNQKSIGL